MIVPQPATTIKQPATDTLLINEMFFSIQGESSYAGLPCTFIRLRGCHLRCNYCDTTYAFHEGDRRTVDQVVEQALTLGGESAIVQVTGGEPLLQPAVHPLMTRLCDAGRTVLIETSGACDIRPCDPRVVRIMDLKTPGSGESHRNMWDNLDALTARDEVKFVLTDETDYRWMVGVLNEHRLAERVGCVLVSAVQPIAPEGVTAQVPGAAGLPIRDLAEWVLRDHLPVRLQTQLHKLIWPASMRGV
jgi:7-carboxy-7-deazaguanine synthase